MSGPASGRSVARALSEAWYRESPSLAERLALLALAPAAWAFGAVSRARSTAYERGWLASARAPLPVISVGNLAVGGAGKTPVVMELVSRLAAAGERPAVLTRGYGGASEIRVVADAGGLRLGVREAGDEPVAVARRHPGVPVLAGPDRVALARLAADEHHASVAILDDGLQHRRLERDLDIVVVDASHPLGNGRLLPCGPLREPPRALERAGLVWLSRVDEAPAVAFGTEAQLETLLAHARAPVVRARYRAEALCTLAGEVCGDLADLESRAVVALAGIARPTSFLQTLTGTGARVVGEALYGDHHRFAPGELTRVLAQARAQQALVVTTEKDAARLPPDLEGVVALRVGVEILAGEAALEGALGRLRGR